MNEPVQIASSKPRKRCAVYCRVSSDERLDQEFNSIDAQREAGHAYVASQRAEAALVDDDQFTSAAAFSSEIRTFSPSLVPKQSVEEFSAEMAELRADVDELLAKKD